MKAFIKYQILLKTAQKLNCFAKHFLFVAFFLFSVLFSLQVLAQGSSCANAVPFCTDVGDTFPAGTNVLDAELAEPGNDYDCLVTSPNPAWYYLEINQSGFIDIALTNTSNVDIDFILYGPFSNLSNAVLNCGSYDANDIVDCSYDNFGMSPIEYATIPNALISQTYILLITNFSNTSTNVEANVTSSTVGATESCTNLTNCPTQVGEITTNEPMPTCDNAVYFNYNNANEFLQAGDIVQFLIYENSNPNVVIDVLEVNEFTLNASDYVFNTQYLIVAVAGPADVNGNVDLTDDCLDFSIGFNFEFVESATQNITSYFCNTAQTTYQFTVQLTGNVSLLNNSLGNIDANNVFTSIPITSGNNLQIFFNDNNCGFSLIATGIHTCNLCPTAVGTILPPLPVCDDEITIQYDDTNQFLETTDVLQFVLHDGSATTVGTNIFDSAFLPDLTFYFAGLNYGTTYYITAIAGPNNGSGTPDLADDCTVFSIGVPVVFYEEPTIVNTNLIEVDASCGLANGSITGLSVNYSNQSDLTYTWTNLNNATTVGNNIDVFNLGTGVYNLVVLTSNGCTDQNTFTITSDPIPNAGMDAAISVCNNGLINLLDNLNGTPDLGGTWYDPDGNVFNNTQFNAVNNLPGIYTYEIDEGNNCVVSATLTISIYVNPTVGAEIITCIQNNTFYQVQIQTAGNLTVNPSFAGNIDNNGLFTSSNIPSTNNYSFDLFDDNNCITFVFGGNFDCGCATSTGELLGEPIQNFCVDINAQEPFMAIFNYDETNEYFDFNDQTLFYVVTDTNDVANTIVGFPLPSQFVEFYDALYNLGQTYYFVAVTGNVNQTGSMNFTAECTQISNAIEFVFYEIPTVQLSVLDYTCETEAVLTFNINSNDTIDIVLDNGSNLIPLQNITENPYEYTVTQEGFYQITTVNNNNCNGTFSGIVPIQFDQSYNIFDTIVGCAGVNIPLPNGNYTTGPGNYLNNLTTTAGCDSIVTIIFSFADSIINNIDVQICVGSYYILPDNSFVVEDGTYTFTETNSLGCDSIINYIIEVVAEFEVDNNVTICTGDDYILPNGDVVSLAGNYTTTIIANNGCDSTIFTALNIIDAYEIEINDGFCEGAGYLLPDGTFTNTAGVYEFEYLSSINCDSFVSINLIETAPFSNLITAQLCEGASFTLPNGNIVTQSIIFTFPNQNQFGCDSNLVYDILFFDVDTFFITETLCQGESYFLPNGTEIFNNTIDTTIIDTAFCNNYIISNIIFNEIAEITIVNGICEGDSFLLNGDYFTQTGIYSDTLIATNGCDSIVSLNLTVHPTYQTTQNINICDITNGYTLPDNNIVFAEGTYNSNFNTIFGCDSIITTNLNITTQISIQQDISICEGDNYISANGNVYTAEGIYTDSLLSASNCDSLIFTTIIYLPFFEANFDYGIYDYCNTDSNPTIITTPTNPGIFTTNPATVAILVDGEIDLTQFITNTVFDVNYITNGICNDTFSQTITIEIQDIALFFYDANVYCVNDANPTPTNYSSNLNGTYSADYGLIVGPITGTIDLNSADINQIYNITYTTNGNCPNSFLQQVSFEAEPDLNFEIPSIYCINDANILPTGLNFSNGNFTADNNLQIDSLTGEIQLNTAQADIIYTINYNFNGICNSSFSQQITFYDAFDATFSYNTNFFCADDTTANLNIIANSGGTFSTNATEITVDSLGNLDLSNATNGSIYDITYNLGDGNCTSSFTQSIEIQNFIQPVLQITPITCIDDTIILEFLNSENFNPADVSWNFDNLEIIEGEGNGPYLLTTNISGNYEVEIFVESAANNCNAIIATAIVKVENLVALPNQIQTVIAGNEIKLEIPQFYSGFLIYTWNDSINLSCTNCYSPNVTPMQNASYTVEVADTISGCTASTLFNLLVEIATPYIPNVFSPNGDGKNDFFKPENLKSVKTMEFAVYNRWGELLFFTNNLQNGWDGNFRNEQENSGVYVWTIQFTMFDDTKIFEKGNVTLLR